MNKERGKILEKLKVEEGVSKAGKAWTKQDFVIQTDEKFPRKICFTLFGDKKDLIHKLDAGEIVDVQFTVESRDFNGKWYHNLNAQYVDLVLDDAQSPVTKTSEVFNGNDYEDDQLPF